MKFAEYDLGKEAKSKTLELQQEIDACSKILEDYTSKQAEADLTFNNYAKRVILVAKDDAEALQNSRSSPSAFAQTRYPRTRTCSRNMSTNT